MMQGTAEAILLQEKCDHVFVACPVCNARFLLSVYLAEVNLKQVQLVKTLRLDHEQDRPHAEHIQL